MPYTPYGWQDAPDGWVLGDPVPPGYEDSEINAENLEAFGEHVAVQSAGANTVIYDDDLGEWPARATDDVSVMYFWRGPTFPDVGGTGNFVSGLDVFIPTAEV